MSYVIRYTSDFFRLILVTFPNRNPVKVNLTEILLIYQTSIKLLLRHGVFKTAWEARSSQLGSIPSLPRQYV